MDVKKCLEKELERLVKMNDKIEKEINSGVMGNKPEQIINNVKAMCVIALIIKYS